MLAPLQHISIVGAGLRSGPAGMAGAQPCCPPPELRRLLLRMPPPENVATGVMAAQKSGPVAVAGALPEWGQTAPAGPVFRLPQHGPRYLHPLWRRCFVRQTECACCPCVRCTHCPALNVASTPAPCSHFVHHQ